MCICTLIICQPAISKLRISVTVANLISSNRMVQQVPENISFPAEEEKILEFWSKHNCFQECLKQSKLRPKYVSFCSKDRLLTHSLLLCCTPLMPTLRSPVSSQSLCLSLQQESGQEWVSSWLSEVVGMEIIYRFAFFLAFTIISALCGWVLQYFLPQSLLLGKTTNVKSVNSL